MKKRLDTHRLQRSEVPWPCRRPSCHRGKRRKMDRHLGASGVSEPFAGTVDGEGHEARTPCPLVFLELNKTRAPCSKWMSYVRQRTEPAEKRPHRSFLKACREQHKDSNGPSGHLSHSMHVNPTKVVTDMFVAASAFLRGAASLAQTGQPGLGRRLWPLRR